MKDNEYWKKPPESNKHVTATRFWMQMRCSKQGRWQLYSIMTTNDLRVIVKYWEANIQTAGHKISLPFMEPQSS
jgi:hypothetical protein